MPFAISKLAPNGFTTRHQTGDGGFNSGNMLRITNVSQYIFQKYSILTSYDSLPTTPTQDFVLYFWNILVAQIPESLKYGETCQQFFDTALSVFRAVDESGRESLDLTVYTQDWSNLLLRHVHDEVSKCRASVLPALTFSSLSAETALTG